MKSAEEIMNMLEAFDLTGSCRGAGELSGVSHHTRDVGRLLGVSAQRVSQLVETTNAIKRTSEFVAS